MKTTICIVTALCLVSTAWAGPIADSSLDILPLGGVFNGDFEGGAADNTTGWSGIDDVITIMHAGGELTLDLTWGNYDLTDIDLRLYDAGESQVAYSYNVPGPEQITGDYAPGTYYAMVDIWSGDPQPYSLAYTPEPATLSLLGLGALVLIRRR